MRNSMYSLWVVPSTSVSTANPLRIPLYDLRRVRYSVAAPRSRAPRQLGVRNSQGRLHVTLAALLRARHRRRYAVRNRVVKQITQALPVPKQTTRGVIALTPAHNDHPIQKDERLVVEQNGCLPRMRLASSGSRALRYSITALASTSVAARDFVSENGRRMDGNICCPSKDYGSKQAQPASSDKCIYCPPEHSRRGRCPHCKVNT